MRKYAALVTSVSVVLGLLLIPFTHVHAAEHHHDGPQHQSAVVHSHFSSHVAGHLARTSIRDNDDDDGRITHLNVFNFSPAAPISIPDLPQTGFAISENQVALVRASAPQVCAHDPPLGKSPCLRAPPA